MIIVINKIFKREVYDVKEKKNKFFDFKNIFLILFDIINIVF